jgi:hypothetical protein
MAEYEKLVPGTLVIGTKGLFKGGLGIVVNMGEPRPGRDGHDSTGLPYVAVDDGYRFEGQPSCIKPFGSVSSDSAYKINSLQVIGHIDGMNTDYRQFFLEKKNG